MTYYQCFRRENPLKMVLRTLLFIWIPLIHAYYVVLSWNNNGYCIKRMLFANQILLTLTLLPLKFCFHKVLTFFSLGELAFFYWAIHLTNKGDQHNICYKKDVHYQHFLDLSQDLFFLTRYITTLFLVLGLFFTIITICKMIRQGNFFALDERDVGLSEEEIMQLGQINYEGHTINRLTDVCSICLSPMESGDIISKIPKCTHIFHFKCVKQWLRTNINCPNCRNDVRKSLQEDENLMGPVSLGLSIFSVNFGENTENHIQSPSHNRRNSNRNEENQFVSHLSESKWSHFPLISSEE
eukprot:TRINITY_DN9210_c0_g1_i1.p1 TRINITY_DN9210_c0_g1~~TRINITY_DN9210_c0_g1_i1.p1  ORF type:complete len:297 (-),score=5.98 TRINITY_DN9210_c0_g1_i1:95-985(-)